MRSKPQKREIDRIADDLLAKLDARLRRPLTELSSFLEWLRRVRFRSEASERTVIEALRAELENFERALLYREPETAALLHDISSLRHQIAELAKGPEKQ